MFKQLFGGKVESGESQAAWAYLCFLWRLKAAQSRMRQDATVSVTQNGPSSFYAYDMSSGAEMLWYLHTTFGNVPSVARSAFEKWASALNVFADFTLNLYFLENANQRGVSTGGEQATQAVRTEWGQELGDALARATADAERAEVALIKRIGRAAEEVDYEMRSAYAEASVLEFVSDAEREQQARRMGSRIEAQMTRLNPRIYERLR